MKPEVGCGAAIYDEAGRLLLLQRRTAPESGAWGLPGGKVDFGEPVQSAIIREIAEELGIVIRLNHLACLTETILSDDGRHWVAPVYTASIVSGVPSIMEPEKHGGCGWFALDALPANLTTPTCQYLDSLKS